MQATFGTPSKNIGELLGRNERRRIAVPQFQRGYSWEKQHVEDFWRDVERFHHDSQQKEGPEKYFLGPIVVIENSRTEITLLDGQQRLATTTILLSIIRCKARSLGTQDSNNFARDLQRDYIIKDDTSEQSFSLALGELDGPYFKELVQTDDAQAPKPAKPPKLRSHNRIYKAKAFLQEAVTKFIASEPPQGALKMLKSLSQTITSDLVVSPISVRDQKEAFRIFETLNDRGLRLSVPDLFLNYLMGAATQDADRKTIRESWNEMLERLGRRDISRFLRHLWLSQHGDLKKTDLFRDCSITGADS